MEEFRAFSFPWVKFVRLLLPVSCFNFRSTSASLAITAAHKIFSASFCRSAVSTSAHKLAASAPAGKGIHLYTCSNNIFIIILILNCYYPAKMKSYFYDLLEHRRDWRYLPVALTDHVTPTKHHHRWRWWCSEKVTCWGLEPQSCGCHYQLYHSSRR